MIRLQLKKLSEMEVEPKCHERRVIIKNLLLQQSIDLNNFKLILFNFKKLQLLSDNILKFVLIMKML